MQKANLTALICKGMKFFLDVSLKRGHEFDQKWGTCIEEGRTYIRFHRHSVRSVVAARPSRMERGKTEALIGR